jgi:hypothetical protein
MYLVRIHAVKLARSLATNIIRRYFRAVVNVIRMPRERRMLPIPKGNPRYS